ncbi:MAG: hypothetical protein ACXVAZ_14635 [Mucilaginibacter sp.]
METQARTNSPITGREGAEIELNVAADWTKNHRDRYPGRTISQFFGIETLQRILKQPGCMGVRIYYANSKPLSGWQRLMVSTANSLKKMAGAYGEEHVILAAVTKEGFDMLPGSNNAPKELKMMAATSGSSGSGSDSAGVLLEQAHPCPGSANCPKNALTGS